MGSSRARRDVVEEGVDGEVAAQAVVFDGAEDAAGVVGVVGGVLALARLHDFYLVVAEGAQLEHGGAVALEIDGA